MKQAILILAHKDFAALRKLIAYFKQDCYVFVEVYVGSDNNIPKGYSVQFRLDDFEGNYMETQILKKIPPEGSSYAKVGTFQYVKDKNYRMFIKVFHNNNIIETAQLP